MQDACESVEKENSLFRINGLELDCLISVLPPARRAPAVEVLLDVVPAESAYLNECKASGKEKRRGRTCLVATRAGLEVEVGEIHLLKAQRAVFTILEASM